MLICKNNNFIIKSAKIILLEYALNLKQIERHIIIDFRACLN
jgi:hypothetical protein